MRAGRTGPRTSSLARSSTRTGPRTSSFARSPMPKTRAALQSTPSKGVTFFAAIACAASLAAIVLTSSSAIAQPHAQPDTSSLSAGQVAKLLEAWDPEGASDVLDKLAASNPNDPGVKWLRGRIAFEQGDYAGAKALYEEAIGPDRAKRSDHWQLADAAEQENRATVVEESAHFSIRYKAGRDAALVPYALDALEAAYEALVSDLDWAPPGKIRVEIYSSPKALARVSSLSLEAIKTTGTIALCKYNRLMITSPRALVRGYEWLDTLTHELVHLLVTRKSGNAVPIWLHEGIAKFLETRWRSDVPLPLEPSSDVLLTRAAKNDKLIPFEKMHPSIALLPTQEDAALAFAEVYSAIELIHQRKGTAGIRAVIEGLRDGKTDKQAVGAAMGTTFERFEADWRRAVKKRLPPKGAHPHLEKLVFRDDRQPAESEDERKKAWEKGELGSLENDDAKRHAHLGELLRARRRLAAAAVQYGKAVQFAGSTHPSLARKYAITLTELERLDEAERILRSTLEVHGEDSTNNLLLGRLLVRTNRAADAREHLLVANRRDPFDPEIHKALVEVARATNDAGLLARETDVLAILGGQKSTWRAPPPGAAEMTPGYLRIEHPMGARVFIDGVDTGLTTPVAEHPLPPGSHVVRLEPREGDAIERAVDVPSDRLVAFPQGEQD